jgi:phage major head subunit gpT-like protein
MPSVARTANFPNATTTRGIHMVVYQAYTQREPVGRKFARVFQSSQYREHTLTFGGLGLMDTKTEGSSVNYEAPVEGFLQTYTHVWYAKGIRITQEWWSDDLYGVMQDSPAELGRMAYATEETILGNIFNNGFDGTSYADGPDGLELFSTVHIREDGSTYRNELSTASDLSPTSLEQALIDYRNFRDGGGKRIQVQPGCLLVAPDNQWNASRILNSALRPTDDTNAVNPLNDVGLRLDVWDYLTDADAWFVGPKNKNEGWIMLYEREPFTSDHIFDFDTGDIKLKGGFRQSSSWGDPRGWFGSPGA